MSAVTDAAGRKRNAARSGIISAFDRNASTIVAAPVLTALLFTRLSDLIIGLRSPAERITTTSASTSADMGYLSAAHHPSRPHPLGRNSKQPSFEALRTTDPPIRISFAYA
ncbi:hypothetical protein [Bradyrhizobium sp. ORS 285]|uniref:hypothetical protein n=1 Tax=Bradyrhizobium sp. ORS 285 TaxID=115808 RepID=UPI001560082C|nr:hypothetical protein [Bradyrhizobium sp. ORS 285]